MDILPMPPDTSKTQDGRWTVLPSDHSSLKGGFPIGIMNICRSPTFHQSFRVEETWRNIKHAFCMLCVVCLCGILRTFPEEVTEQQQSRLARVRESEIWTIESILDLFLIFFIFIPKKDPELDMIFCHEFLLLATKGPRQHGHCGRPRSVAQDFTCFRFPDLHTHTHQDAPHAGQCPASSVSECHWQQESRSVMIELFPSFSSWEANNEVTLRGQQSFF